MEIRAIQREDIKQVKLLCSQAFMHGSRDMHWFDDPNEMPTEAVGVWEESELQAQVVVIAYRVHLGPEVVVPMGGIAGVACLPASRGKGYAGVALRRSLEVMRDAGQVVSALFPFSWDYYRRFGWEWVGVRRRYTVATRALEVFEETEQVRAAKPEDRPVIVDLYTRFAHGYRGMMARHEKQWNVILDHTEKEYAFSYLYEHEGRAEGYLTYRGGSSEKTDVREFLCLTERSRRGLLGLLHRHEMQTEKFAWSAPVDDRLWHAVNHWDVETKIGPVTQARVVDVAGALGAWRPDPAVRGAVALAVHDPNASWNDGAWRVEFEEGRVTAQRTDAAPQVSLDIRALSQAYWGTPTVDDLRASDRLQVHDESGFTAFRALLAGPPMWMNNSF